MLFAFCFSLSRPFFSREDNQNTTVTYYTHLFPSSPQAYTSSYHIYIYITHAPIRPVMPGPLPSPPRPPSCPRREASGPWTRRPRASRRRPTPPLRAQPPLSGRRALLEASLPPGPPGPCSGPRSLPRRRSWPGRRVGERTRRRRCRGCCCCCCRGRSAAEAGRRCRRRCRRRRRREMSTRSRRRGPHRLLRRPRMKNTWKFGQDRNAGSLMTTARMLPTKYSWCYLI